MENIYQPCMARIVRIVPLISDTKLFQMRFEDESLMNSFSFLPGQFVELSIIGVGEAPISISSSPSRPGVIELCVRKVGRVTEKLHEMRQNERVGLRGPYGNGFPMEGLKDNNILLIAGGLGMAPLRSLLWYAIDNRMLFSDVTLMYGAREPENMLFRDELVSLMDRQDIRCLLTVDSDTTGNWRGKIGKVTDLFEGLDIDAKTTYACVCGPPIMYKFVLKELLKRNFSKDHILMSLERRMKCGVGKCLHCSIGHKYVCLDGPIFTYWDAINLKEII